MAPDRLADQAASPASNRLKQGSPETPAARPMPTVAEPGLDNCRLAPCKARIVTYTSSIVSFATFDSTTWPDGIIQLLDDHHLVVISGNGQVRRQFARALAEQLTLIEDTEVVAIEGHKATELPSFCGQLERGLRVPTRDLSPWWRDIESMIEVLRVACTGPKRRYFIWQDADAMLEADVQLFCRVVNAFCGVAAECEHVSVERLVLMRMIFVGGDKLGAYAEDTTGQFRAWLDDGEDSPFWEVMSVIDRPPVLVYRLDG